MITTAIIAEFNPLHSGHKYIIEEARRITGADCIIIILSGNFTQRGDIAIAPKHIRAAGAIACGADVVIELPFVYASSSAEFFASGAVTLLESLTDIDYLVFGAENGDTSLLDAAAEVLLCEPPVFKKTLNACLSSGMSFPVAREQAFISCGGAPGVFTPNNTLAIEYIKALKKLHSGIRPLAVTRTGAGYNDTEYSVYKGFISASAFRTGLEAIMTGSSSESASVIFSQVQEFLTRTLPKESADILMSSYNKSFPVFNDDMLMLIRYAILMKRSHLEDFCDFTPALANRIRRMLTKEGNTLFSGSYEDFILKLKTKDITAARIKRAMLHLLTGFTSEADLLRTSYLKNGRLPYARLLALSPSGKRYISAIKKGCDITLINSLGKSMSLLDPDAQSLIHYDILSSDIYASVAANRFGYNISDEYRTIPKST